MGNCIFHYIVCHLFHFSQYISSIRVAGAGSGTTTGASAAARAGSGGTTGAEGSNCLYFAW
jgi:hypothetical protein